MKPDNRRADRHHQTASASPESRPRRFIDCGICDGTGFVYPVEEAVEPCPLCAGRGTLKLEVVGG